MNPQNTKKRVLKWALVLLLSALILLLIPFLILQLPAVQQNVTERLLGRFNQLTGYPVKVDKIYLTWYDKLEVSGLSIRDSLQSEMITASQLDIDFNLFGLLTGDRFTIDQVSLNEPNLKLKWYGSANNRKLNITGFAEQIQKLTGPSKDTLPGRPVFISKVFLKKGMFSISDTLNNPITKTFNPTRFSVDIPSAKVINLNLKDDSIDLMVETLSATELEHQWPLHSFSSQFHFQDNKILFSQLKAKAGDSFLGDSLVVKLPDALVEDEANVSLVARLRNCKIGPKDIAFFTGQSLPIDQYIETKGDFSGSVDDFSFRNFTVKIGASSVNGMLEMEGLPVLDETFINARIKKATINPIQFNRLIPAEVQQRIAPFGMFSMAGNFTGFINDFVTDAKFNTRIGGIESNLNFKIQKGDILKSSYKGRLKLNAFNAGALISDTSIVKTITMSGSINGSGLTRDNADFVLDGKFDELNLLGYPYKGISSRARFARELFIGQVVVNDPYLKLKLDGSIDLRDNRNQIRLAGKIDTLAVRELGLSKEPFAIKTEVKVTTTGLTLDDLAGQLLFKKIKLLNDKGSLGTDSIHILAIRQPKSRRIIIGSSLATLEAHGNFRFDNLFNDLSAYFKEILLNAANNKEEIKKYYSAKSKEHTDYRMDFLFRLHDLNPVLTFFSTGIEISKRIQLSGHFINGYTSILHAYSNIPKLVVDDLTFTGNEVDFNGSKISDSTRVLAMLLISSERQQLTKSITTKNLILEGIWNGGHIDLGLDFDQEGYDNIIRINSELDFLSDSIRWRFLPSRLRLLGKEWKIDPGNMILAKGKEVQIKNLSLAQQNRSMVIQGNLSEKSEETLKIKFNELSMDLVNSLIGEKLDGRLNGELNIKNYYTNTSIQSEFRIDELTINQFLAGDVTGTNNWDTEQEAFVINFRIDRMQRRIVDVTGLYVPGDDEKPLRLVANLNQTQIKIFEPLMKDLFSNWSGTATGAFDISGDLSKPIIKGSAEIADGQVTVNYLNSTYKLKGTVAAEPGNIEFKNLELGDLYTGKGLLKGQIRHENFSNFRLNLEASFRNLQALNTNAKQNDLFYGQACATGSLKISGPTDRINIQATARTDKNTRIYIPVGGTSTVERSSFIRFVNLRDSTTQHEEEEQERKKKSTSSLSMNFNLDITPDAYSEIIFDIKAGDIIRGWGTGNLKLDIDTQGDFSMFGSYEFDRGFYNFTLGGVINKEFAINKGSKISWFGDPYGGTLSINAAYRQLASLMPILTSPNSTTTPPASLRRKFPIEVNLLLDGPMLSPQINFDINARDLPENLPGDQSTGPIPVKFQFNAFKARLDEQELKKQVFSLIVLRRFTPQDAFTTSGGLTNSVSEFLSNQLSYWLSQVDQNLEVTLDLGSLDEDAFNISQLRMSYSLMNGRLRVTRDGTLFSNQYNQSNMAALAGDWTVDYLLTPDGKFKVKMYSRSNYNALLSAINTQTAYTTGLSLSHTQSFNRFTELLRSSRKRARENNLDEEDF